MKKSGVKVEYVIYSNRVNLTFSSTKEPRTSEELYNPIPTCMDHPIIVTATLSCLLLYIANLLCLN